MTFTSFEFLLFFPLVVLLYNIIPQKFRLFYLLAVSYGFYALLQPVYLVLLAAVTAVTYFFAKWIYKQDEDKKRFRLLIIGIILVVAPLFFFKYFNFLDESLTSLFHSFGLNITMPTIRWMLPLGISYYTFMALGYLIDCYNEEVEPENNVCVVGLFLSFFPIVLSGPIERAKNMFPQIKTLDRSKPTDITSGAKMMLWGYFMKLCVADRLAIYISAVNANVMHHTGTSLGFAALLFPIQEYADLGGYSLLAIGVARCLGFKVIENFRRPFFSTSMSEFWRRWHISLIKWLTDYIYTPMSYLLRSWAMKGMVLSLLVTFLVSGIWHGACMTCIAWGLMQGVLLSIEAVSQPKRTKLEKKYNLMNNKFYMIVCMLCVYLLFAFSEIYGMSTNFSDANLIVKKIFTEPGSLFIHPTSLILGLMSVSILFIKDLKDECKWSVNFMHSGKMWVSILSFSLLLCYVILFGILDGGQFIYAQF